MGRLLWGESWLGIWPASDSRASSRGLGALTQVGRGRTRLSGGAGELPPSASSPGTATCLRRSRLPQGPLRLSHVGPQPSHRAQGSGSPAEPLGALTPRQRPFLPAPRRARCVASQPPGLRTWPFLPSPPTSMYYCMWPWSGGLG